MPLPAGQRFDLTLTAAPLPLPGCAVGYTRGMRSLERRPIWQPSQTQRGAAAGRRDEGACSGTRPQGNAPDAARGAPWPWVLTSFGLSLGALAAIACTGPRLGQTQQAASVCAAGPTLLGIDVSSYQGVIDWPAVKASGVVFAYIRASDGMTYPDTTFAANWANARTAGVLRGAYQFFREDEDPVAEADFFLTMMGPLEPDDLPPVIDVETADGQSQSDVVVNIGKWLDEVQTGSGRKPMVYAGLYSWPTLTGGTSAYADYSLWVPQYGPTCPTLPSPWTNWAFFQYSDNVATPGIPAGGVDGDTFNGDMNALEAFMALPPDAGNNPADATPVEVTLPDARMAPVGCDGGRSAPAAGRPHFGSSEITGACSVTPGANPGQRSWIWLGFATLLFVGRRLRRSRPSDHA